MDRDFWRILVFLIFLAFILPALIILSFGILSKNSQDIDLFSAIIAIFLAIILTWLLDMIDDLYEKIKNKEYIDIKRVEKIYNR